MGSRIVRAFGIGLGILLGLAVVVVAGVFLGSETRLKRMYTTTPEMLLISTNQELLARGQHLASAATRCTGCHGGNLAGQVMVDAPPFRIVAPNLTSGKGGVGPLSDADWIRAIRHGVAADGTPLMLMPSSDYQALSADDLAAIIAYVKSVPPVDNVLPDSELRPLGRVLLLAGQLPILEAERIDHGAVFGLPAPVGPTEAYGGYLVTIGGCRTCHGGNLGGGQVPDGSNVPAPAINTAGMAGWSEADFVAAMRTGVSPNGKPIAPIMPWEAVGQLSDDELRAVWLYLQSQ